MMTAWFTRMRRTRTDVHDEASQDKDRRLGVVNAYRVLAVIQITAQLLLWVTLKGYDSASHTVWQTTALLFAPLALLFWLWRAGRAGIATRAGKVAGLVLIPCLWLDAALLLDASIGLCVKLIPTNTRVFSGVFIVAMCFLAVCLGRENGVAYGTGKLRMLMLVLFVLGTLLLGADVNPTRLWPLLGRGFGNSVLSALTGVGGVWGVALLFVLPPPKAPSATRQSASQKLGESVWPAAVYAILPWVLAMIWALWCGLTQPWHSGDLISIGDKLTGIARRSSSILLCEINNVMWLLLFPLALTGTATGGEKLLRASFTKLPRSLCCVIMLLPAAVLILAWPDAAHAFLNAALPYRAALGVISGLIVLFAGRRERMA